MIVYNVYCKWKQKVRQQLTWNFWCLIDAYENNCLKLLAKHTWIDYLGFFSIIHFWSFNLQGSPWWSGFFLRLSLTMRYVQVRFCSNVVLISWDYTFLLLQPVFVSILWLMKSKLLLNFIAKTQINASHIGRNWKWMTMNEEIKILGAILELPARQQCQSRPFTTKMGQMNWIGSAV